MSIPLNAFEQYIDPAILSRGQTYFKQGRVGEPELIKANHIEFVVAGSDEYKVTILFDKEEIKHHDCTCPYEEDVCKAVGEDLILANPGHFTVLPCVDF